MKCSWVTIMAFTSEMERSIFSICAIVTAVTTVESYSPPIFRLWRFDVAVGIPSSYHSRVKLTFSNLVLACLFLLPLLRNFALLWLCYLVVVRCVCVLLFLAFHLREPGSMDCIQCRAINCPSLGVFQYTTQVSKLKIFRHAD